MTDTLAAILARIEALRAQRKLARQHGDVDAVIELTNEMGRLSQAGRKLQQEQQQEAQA